MQSLHQQLRNDWSTKFPEVSDEWPYWWIEGDQHVLAIIDGSNLIAAVEIIEDNWEQFESIKAYSAKCIYKDLVRRNITGHLISTREGTELFFKKTNSEPDSEIQSEK